MFGAPKLELVIQLRSTAFRVPGWLHMGAWMERAKHGCVVLWESVDND